MNALQFQPYPSQQPDSLPIPDSKEGANFTPYKEDDGQLSADHERRPPAHLRIKSPSSCPTLKSFPALAPSTPHGIPPASHEAVDSITSPYMAIGPTQLG